MKRTLVPVLLALILLVLVGILFVTASAYTQTWDAAHPSPTIDYTQIVEGNRRFAGTQTAAAALESGG